MAFNLAHYNRYLIKSVSTLAAACLLGLTPIMTSQSAYAITTSHPSAGGHVSATHATTPAARPTPSTAARPTTTTTTRSTTSAGTTKAASTATSLTRSNTATTSRPSSRQVVSSVAANRTPSESRAIHAAAHTDTYDSLATTSQRYSYLDWYGAYSGAYHSPINYFTNIGYFWMPGNIWHAVMTNSAHDRLSQAMINQARARHYYWITVGHTKVAVPQDIYDKIQVGDSVKLIDGHHIQINGHMYKQ